MTIKEDQMRWGKRPKQKMSREKTTKKYRWVGSELKERLEALEDIFESII